MCALTHFAYPDAPYTESSSTTRPPPLQQPERNSATPARPRFQVILAGNAFFHIKETATGCVRGFRGDHNEACALARALESHT